jgi:hypothetical protein
VAPELSSNRRPDLCLFMARQHSLHWIVAKDFKPMRQRSLGYFKGIRRTRPRIASNFSIPILAHQRFAQPRGAVAHRSLRLARVRGLVKTKVGVSYSASTLGVNHNGPGAKICRFAEPENGGYFWCRKLQLWESQGFSSISMAKSLRYRRT